MNANETTESYFTKQYNPSTVISFPAETKARHSGKEVSIDMYPNKGSQISEQNNRYDGPLLKTRKTERVLATLSAIAMGSASVIITQVAAHVGCFTLGAAGAMLGGMIEGPEGQLTGGRITEGQYIGVAVGGAIGYFTGFSVAAYLSPYMVAKAYNFVLEASNGAGCERSKLADRVVAYYER
ncbi:hypothetical protein J7438_19755 [Thalassotalea sp. G20_0]|uniref:hypothetical protein n=1 Tax=Thalassotalea sp. G20_0 TaxID=2821093 RepID=UPI001ADBDEBC|nr:hypothetical protein [Thalassotalea sp. G20_0]MBO9496294.1 hypothetical protein [Thalassotalea sp. G20_0]